MAALLPGLLPKLPEAISRLKAPAHNLAGGTAAPSEAGPGAVAGAAAGLSLRLVLSEGPTDAQRKELEAALSQVGVGFITIGIVLYSIIIL